MGEGARDAEGVPVRPRWRGVGLVVLGSLAIGIAAWQHAKFWKGLEKPYQTRLGAMKWSVVFAMLVTVIGLALGAYLVLSAGDDGPHPAGAHAS